jgi:hypothetical protein
MTGMTCSVETCDRPVRSRGLCRAHEQRLRLNGFVDPDRPVQERRRPKPRPKRFCSVDGCDKLHFGLGLCAMHYERQRRNGTTDKPKGKPGARGAVNRHWKGDDVGYNAMHARVRTRLGSAREQRCVDCDGAASGWSYDHADPDEKTGLAMGVERQFSTDITHYVPRCKRCHSLFDHAHRRHN